MNKKEKNEILSKICDDINPKDEAMFAIYAGVKKGDYYAKGNMELVKNGIADILRRGIAGEEDSPSTVVAWTILCALRDLQDEGVDIEDLLAAFDEEEDDDCDTCELLKVCDNERAIAWRKALGIPRPKKVHKIMIN